MFFAGCTGISTEHFCRPFFMYGGLFICHLLYFLLLYLPEIIFDPRYADPREFDEVGYVLDENAFFENTCLGPLG